VIPESDYHQNNIDITYKNIDPPEWVGGIEDFCKILLHSLGIKNWEVSLLFCDKGFIQELNKKYRAKNYPTDVLAFPQCCDTIDVLQNIQGEKIYAGDIVISLPVVSDNAYKYEIQEEEELKRLIIHGMLHLLGMDHKEEDSKMLFLQEKLLKDLMGG